MAWKRFMGYVYGWGASIVLIGALFKIMHYPYAGLLLTVGLSVEAIIFFFSAFEPPYEPPNWNLVYPELDGSEPGKKQATGGIQTEALEQLQQFFENLKLEPEKISGLSEGMAKLTNVAENLSTLSDAAKATDGYTQTMTKVSESIGQVSEKYVNTTQQLSASADQLKASYQDAASSIEDSGKNFADKLNHSGENMLNTYQKIGDLLQNNHTSMDEMNRNLSSLNAVYELQLKQSSQQVENAKTAHQDLDKILEALAVTLENAKEYRSATTQLNQNISALNTIYGNMLSAMDYSRKA